MVVLHIKKHGSTQESLAAIPAGPSTRASLAQLGDPQIDASLARFSSGATNCELDADRTASFAVGSPTSDGQRFRILRPHARGGLGTIFVALDSELHREVALKQILESHADDPVSRRRFLLEAEVTGGLEHPGIVPVYGLGTDADGRPYYAMRFIKGDSLKTRSPPSTPTRSSRASPVGGPWNCASCCGVSWTCATRSSSPTAGASCTIKPSNVVLGKHGETQVVDWGLAKAWVVPPATGSDEKPLVPSPVERFGRNAAGLGAGDPGVHEPRAGFRGAGPARAAMDVYSLGATLYCLLTGEPPTGW